MSSSEITLIICTLILVIGVRLIIKTIVESSTIKGSLYLDGNEMYLQISPENMEKLVSSNKTKTVCLDIKRK